MTPISLAKSQAPFSNTIGDQPVVIRYDFDAVARDRFRSPRIAARVKELKREKRRQELAREIAK